MKLTGYRQIQWGFNHFEPSHACKNNLGEHGTKARISVVIGPSAENIPRIGSVDRREQIWIPTSSQIC